MSKSIESSPVDYHDPNAAGALGGVQRYAYARGDPARIVQKLHLHLSTSRQTSYSHPSRSRVQCGSTMSGQSGRPAKVCPVQLQRPLFVKGDRCAFLICLGLQIAQKDRPRYHPCFSIHTTYRSTPLHLTKGPLQRDGILQFHLASTKLGSKTRTFSLSPPRVMPNPPSSSASIEPYRNACFFSSLPPTLTVT